MAISYVGAGTEGTATGGGNPAAGYPAGLAAGDVLLLFCETSVATAFATNAVTGFTRRYDTDANGSSPHGALFWKYATGTETGTRSVTSPGGITLVQMTAYRGCDQTDPFDAGGDAIGPGSSVATTAYTVSAQTIAAAGAVGITHAFSNANSGSYTPAASYTELTDSTGAAVAGAMQVAHRLNLSTGSTGTRSIVRAGSVRGGWAGIALQPATGTQQVVSGTVDATSTVSGTTTLAATVTGTVAAATALTAAATLLASVTGTVPATTATSLAVASRQAITGTTTAISTTTGTVGLRAAVSGTVAVTSSTLATIALQAGVTGTITVTSTVSGAAGLPIVHHLAPVERLHDVPAETRTARVPPDPRRYDIADEDRHVTIAPDLRTHTVPAETRTLDA